jgi:hypothetical protein
MSTFALTISGDAPTFALKVGKNTREIDGLTALAVGHKDAMLAMRSVAFKAAFAAARHGRYRAAVEVMQFAAAPAQFKACAPADGNWNKKRLGMLVELVLGRATPKSGKWTDKALIGRQMARLLDDLLEGRALPPEYAETATPVPPMPVPAAGEGPDTPDPLAGAAGEPAPF